MQAPIATAGDVLVGSDAPLQLDDVVRVARLRTGVRIADTAFARIRAARALVEELTASGRAIYGVTTGLGDLSHVRVSEADLLALQANLVESHATGVGEPLEDEVVRAIMLLLANSLAKGFSGVRLAVVELLVELLERDLVPVIPSRGSVGASGDLAPLAHLARTLCGSGEIRRDGASVPSGRALRDAKLRPLVLEPKEGLALVNGTHLMAGAGALLVHDALRLARAAELVSILSADVLLASVAPMDPRIHELRRRARQSEVAARVRAALVSSQLLASHADCARVQDAYTVRCIPQVLGAVLEALDYVSAAIVTELDAVTDNPLCFPEDGDVVSGGNFHGQPLALPLDHLAVLLTELAAFSERRTYRLLSDRGEDALPPFLATQPGTSSGLMLLQYTAAALVAESQVLSHPAGTASLPTSAGQEDFNSMGATAALKARQVLSNAQWVVAIEALCAARALELRRPLRSSAVLEELHRRIRGVSAPLTADRSLAADIEAMSAAIAAGVLDDVHAALCGETGTGGSDGGAGR